MSRAAFASVTVAMVMAAVTVTPARAEESPIDKLSLAETLQFLVVGLKGQGPVTFDARVEDPSGQLIEKASYSFQVVEAVGDERHCDLSIKVHVESDGETTRDGQIVVDLKHAAAVRVGPWATYNLHGRDWRPEFKVITTPDVWEMIVDGEAGHQTGFDFYDHAGADQAADAVRHAKYLCDARR